MTVTQPVGNALVDTVQMVLSPECSGMVAFHSLLVQCNTSVPVNYSCKLSCNMVGKRQCSQVPEASDSQVSMVLANALMAISLQVQS
jgi:hypothetical protein